MIAIRLGTLWRSPPLKLPGLPEVGTARMLSMPSAMDVLLLSIPPGVSRTDR